MPTHIQFASGRPDSESPIVTTASGGSLSARTIWIGLQKRNRVGYNRMSSLVQVAIAAGQKLQVQIPAAARRSGEDWQEFVIVAAAANTPQNAVKLATVKGYVSGVPLGLPYTLELTRDEHLELAPNVATPAALPTGSDLVQGMIRGVVSTGFFYAYDPSSAATPDGLTVFSATPTGRWLRSAAPQTYLVDLRGSGGCDIPAASAPDTVAQSYTVDGSVGEKFSYWVLNDNSIPSGAFIPQGAKLNLGFAQDGITISDGLSGKMGVIFQGHWDTPSGTLDASMPGAGGSSIYYNGAAGAFTLQQNLQPAQAWAFQVFPQVASYELQDLSPDGALITVSAKIYRESGVPTEVGFLFGDFVASDGQKGRIYPGDGLSLVAGSRSGVIADHAFHKIGTSVITGLQASTANQIVVIDSNGNTYAPTGSIPISARRRAQVGTLPGTSNPGSLSASATLSSAGSLKITCNHPVEVDGNGIIRSDYPDRIAGEAVGEFNPPQLSLFVRRSSNGEIREFSGRTVLDDLSQDFTLSDWATGVVVGTLPSAPASDFSLYAPGATQVTPLPGGAGGFPAGSYQATFAYGFDGNQVTSISHPDNDTSYIYEIASTFVELFAHLDDFNNPHQVGFAVFTGSPGLVAPAFVNQIWLAEDTGLIYQAIGTDAGDLNQVGGSGGGSSFVDQLITTMVFA